MRNLDEQRCHKRRRSRRGARHLRAGSSLTWPVRDRLRRCFCFQAHLQVFKGFEAGEGVVPEDLQLILVKVQAPQFGQSVKSSHSDVLECIVAKVYRHRVAKVQETVAIETPQRVPLEVEFERADPRV